MVTVYGPAQHERAQDFIVELSRKCLVASLPLVFGGDFNLIRSREEKSSGQVNQSLIDRFNMFIDCQQLQEINRSGPKFTWTNKQANPIMVALDRFLVSTEWEAKYPLCFAWSKTRVGSDHWPIFLDSGESSINKQKHFFFEKHWLMEEDFLSIFSNMWEQNENRSSNKQYSLSRWHGCLSLTRQDLRGWQANKNDEARKNKTQILNRLEAIDCQGQNQDLEARTWLERYQLEGQLE
jgi:hypothetical protein